MAKHANPVSLLLLFSVAIFFLPSSSYAQLQYHNGPLLTSPINIYLTWYGPFPSTHKAVISGFFASFARITPRQNHTVSGWWSTIHAYKDLAGKPASEAIRLAGQYSDTTASLGKALKQRDLANLVSSTIGKGKLPKDPNGIYFILTASSITIDHFCMGSCGFHSVLPVENLVWAHVGDPATQCPGLCAWPFAVPAYGPPGPPLEAPNGVGVDGMIMNIATVLAGTVTNPRGNGYYQGDKLAPLEAVTACPGIFGAGAYPGYPGELLVDGRSKASFNVYGSSGRKYLVPAIWDLVSSTCKVA